MQIEATAWNVSMPARRLWSKGNFKERWHQEEDKAKTEAEAHEYRRLIHYKILLSVAVV